MKKIIYFVMLLGLLFSIDAAAQSGKKIYINPGHGQFTGNDRNIATINYNLGNSNGFYESKSNCIKGNHLYNFLVGNGASASRSRTTTGPGLDHNLSTIAGWANSWGATVFISIHSNGANASANYGLICFNGTDSAPKYTASKTFGNAVWDKMLTNNLTSYTAYSITNRNVRGDRSLLGYNLGVLSPLTRPGILTEGTFHDYPPEAHRLLSANAYCRMEAWNFFRGINAYFGTSIPNGTTNGKGGAVVGWVKDNTKTMNNARYKYRSGSFDQWVPLHGCKVDLMSGNTVVQTYTTDNEYNGCFGFFGVNAGTYSLRFTKSGYNCKVVNGISVSAGGCTYRQEYMQPGSTNNCGGGDGGGGTTTPLTLKLDKTSIGINGEAILSITQGSTAVSRLDCDLTSSNNNVATISAYGTVTGKSAGTATLKAVKGAASGTINITVTGSGGTTNTGTLQLNLSSTSGGTNTPMNTTSVAAGRDNIYLYIKDSSGTGVSRVDCELTSSNTGVATISAYGTITTIAAGQTTIKAVKGSSSGSLIITVTGATGGGGGGTTPGTGLTLSLSENTSSPTPVISNTVAKGKTVYLHIKETSNSAVVGRQDCDLTSSNTGVATISAYGTIIAGQSDGTVTIKAVRKSDKKEGVLTLTVGAGGSGPVVSSEDFTLNLSTESTNNVPVSPANTIALGKVAYLHIKDNATGAAVGRQDCDLTSSNEGLATISAFGTTTAGQIDGTITLKAVRKSDNKSGTLVVKIGAGGQELPPVVGQGEPLTLSLDKSTIGLKEKAELSIKTKAGAVVNRQDCVLASDDNEIATISPYGTVTGISAGTTKLRAYYTDANDVESEGEISITVTSTYVAPFKSFTLVLVPDAAYDIPVLTALKVGEEASLIIIDDNGNRVSRIDCELTSSNEEIATISEFGTVVALSPGIVTFTVLHLDTNIEETYTLTIESGNVNILTPEGDRITVHPTKTGITVAFTGEAVVELFTANGILIDKAQAYQSYSRNLDKGFYVIRIKNQSIKFVK